MLYIAWNLKRLINVNYAAVTDAKIDDAAHIVIWDAPESYHYRSTRRVTSVLIMWRRHDLEVIN